MLILMLIMMLKFCVKESPNLIGLENFGAARFSITAELAWCSPSQSKSDQPPTPIKIQSLISMSIDVVGSFVNSELIKSII